VTTTRQEVECTSVIFCYYYCLTVSPFVYGKQGNQVLDVRVPVIHDIIYENDQQGATL